MKQNADSSEPESDAEHLFRKGLTEYKNKKYAAAVELFREAAETGYADAQVMLGVCCRNGLGIQQDYAETARWFHRAAEQGHAEAQYLFGSMFITGRPSMEGPDSDDRNAAKWFRLAAEQGYAEAQYKLGIFLLNGRGVQRDLDEAVKWLRSAAEQGHAEALQELRKAAVTWFRTPHDHEPGAFERNSLQDLSSRRNDGTGDDKGSNDG